MKNRRKPVLRFVFETIWMFATMVLVSYHFNLPKIYLAQKEPIVQKVDDIIIDSPPDEEEIQEPILVTIEKYSHKYGIDAAVIKAMAVKESGLDPYAVRYEPKWKHRYSKQWKRKTVSSIPESLIYSTIGLLQISYGFHSVRCGLRAPTDLFNPIVNLECGISRIADCMEKNDGIKNRSTRLKICVKEHNGSGRQAERYAEDVLRLSKKYG